MTTDDIKRMIEAGLPECRVDIHGDGTHFEAIIISPAFAGKGMLQQHRLVYATLGEHMGTAIHALSMRTYTPEQWQQRQTGAAPQ